MGGKNRLGGNVFLARGEKKIITTMVFGLSERNVEVSQLERDNRRSEKRQHVLSTLSQPINRMYCSF